MSTEHPDEGTIHAWLDGELDGAASARLAAHVAGCAACSAAVAEARGLIAGASRVVASLDDGVAPAPVVATGGAVPRATPASAVPRWLRVTPKRAAIAATLLVVAGLTLMRDQVARESALTPPPVAVRRAETPEPMAAATPPAQRDPLLDSAIRRNVAQALPPRRLERAPGPNLVAPLAPPAPAAVDTTAGLRVAEGRVEARARTDTAPVAAEHAAAPLVVAGAPSAAAGMARRRAMAPMSAMPASKDMPSASVAGADVAAKNSNTIVTPHAQCYRIEGEAGATWGGVALPLVVMLGGDHPDEGPWRAVTDAAVTGRWSHMPGDTLRLARHGDRLVVGAAGAVVARAVSCP